MALIAEGPRVPLLSLGPICTDLHELKNPLCGPGTKKADASYALSPLQQLCHRMQKDLCLLSFVNRMSATSAYKTEHDRTGQQHQGVKSWDIQTRSDQLAWWVLSTFKFVSCHCSVSTHLSHAAIFAWLHETVDGHQHKPREHSAGQGS